MTKRDRDYMGQWAKPHPDKMEGRESAGVSPRAHFISTLAVPPKYPFQDLVRWLVTPSIRLPPTSREKPEPETP